MLFGRLRASTATKMPHDASNVKKGQQRAPSACASALGLGHLHRRVGVHRLRPVHLLDFDFSAIGGISGAWKPTPRRDILLVASNATGLRRVAVVCHEISHMWLQHTPDDLGFTGDQAMDALHHELQEASPELARKFVLYRHGYESSAEADAEYLVLQL